MERLQAELLSVLVKKLLPPDHPDGTAAQPVLLITFYSLTNRNVLSGPYLRISPSRVGKSFFPLKDAVQSLSELVPRQADKKTSFTLLQPP